MRYLTLIGLSLTFLSSTAFAQEKIDANRLAKAEADRMAWKPVTYKGNNQVEICDSSISQSACRTIMLPKSLGAVNGIVYGASKDLPQSWLAFSNGQINLCVEDSGSSKCTFVTREKIGNVKIAYDVSTQYSTVLYLSTPNNHAAVEKVARNFIDSIKTSVENIKTDNIQENKLECEDCQLSPNLEDPGSIPTVYITAPFPAISIFDGGVQFITVSFTDDYAGLPNPMPDGVSPGDILNARDPVRMAACTAAWYRVYITMTMDCSRNIPANYSAWSSCMRKSMDAYANNVKDDCYKNYY